MNSEKIVLHKAETTKLLRELALDAGSLSGLTALYEEMRADLEANPECPEYLNSVALGAMQRGVMALAESVDRAVFELGCIVSQSETLEPETAAD